MKRTFFLFLILPLTLSSFSQNVGVGTTTPAERLDVNGNIRVSGNIMPGGNAGTAGQVLARNSSGGMEWADLSGFKNFETYSSGTGIEFFIPANVTKIAVELWGAGGGGSVGGGGGGGAYVLTILDVTPQTIISFTVGSPGTGSSTVAGNGEQTSFTYQGATYSASGGNGAGLTTAGDGSQFHSGSGFKFIVLPGENGNPTTERIEQYTATSFLKAFHYGNGGKGGNISVGTEGKGGFRTIDLVGQNQLSSYTAKDGRKPGGGGGGGNPGANGGNGVITFRW